MAEPPSTTPQRLKSAGKALLYGTVFVGIVSASQFWVDYNRDRRERTLHFHDLILEADASYCETEADGVQMRTRTFIDRAAHLEPRIADELISLDYMTLAAIGSSFWSRDRAHDYGMRALEIGRRNGDIVEEYAANLVLGHIDFTAHNASGEPEYLNEAREHFTRAKQLITKNTSYQNRHFAAQLYLLWGQHELFAGYAEASEELFALAEDEYRALPHNDYVYKIRIAKQSAKDGIPPRVPCPSQVTVSPPLRENPNLSESQHREPNSENPRIAPQPGVADQIKFDERITQIEGGLESLGTKINDEVANLRSLIKDAGGGENREPAPPPAQPPDEPKYHDNEGWVPSPDAGRQRQCEFEIFNSTAHSLRPIINGFDVAEYSIPPGKVVKFICDCDTGLRLEHRQSQYLYRWPPTIFWKSDGSQAVPFIEMTACCFIHRNL